MDLTMDPSHTSVADPATDVPAASEDCNFVENDAVIVVSNKKEAKLPKTTRRRKLPKNEVLTLDNSSQVHTRSSKNADENVTSPASISQEIQASPLTEECKVASKITTDDINLLPKIPLGETGPDKEEPLPSTPAPGHENVFDGKQTAVSAESSVPALQPSVLQALGLSRGLGIGVGLANTINLSKSAVLNPDQNRTAQTSVVSSATSTLPKTVPLLLNMPGGVGAGSVPSLLPANLPPGRYVIISSTSASPSSPLATITTTTSCGHSQSAPVAPLAVAALQASSTTAASTSSLSVSSSAAPMPATVHKRSVTRLSPNGGGLKSSIRASVGKTRGMRKSYTNSEKLAMIEAVESGLRKSVVADKFGVAPSTLACIILQKEKIRRDQTKSSLSRRRIRPSSDSSLPSLQYHTGSAPPAYPGDSSDCAPHDGDYCKGDSSTTDGGHGGHLSARARSPPPFTHFLANFDQSMSFDSAQAEEIVSVPDLTQSLSFTADGVVGCSPGLPICAPAYCPPAVSSSSSSSTPVRASSQPCPQGDHVQEDDQRHHQEAIEDRRDDVSGESEQRQRDLPSRDAPPASSSTRPRNPSHAAKNVSVLDRVQEFGDILMTDPSGQTLLCWACGFRLDHTRRSTIVEHLRSRKHGRCYLVAQALKTYALSSLGSTALALDLVKEEPDSCPAKESGCLPDVDGIVTDGGTAHTDTSGGPSDDHRSAAAPKPATDDPPETASADPGTESQLSGLCLVKREVHCYSVLDQLLKDQAYTDVTITAAGHTFYAHKVVLCVASGYFRRVLADQTSGARSVVVFRDVHGHEMKNILQFLYTGEATVDASDLASFMRTAQMLEIASLCDEKFQIPTPPPAAAAAALSPPAPSCDPLMNLSTLFSPNTSANLSPLYPANVMPCASTNPSPNLNTLFSSTNALPIVTNALRQQGLLTHQTMSQLQQLQSHKQQQQVVAEQLQHLREQLHATCSQMFMQSDEDDLKTSRETTSPRKHSYSSEVQDLTYTKTSKSSFECPSSVPRGTTHAADDTKLPVSCDVDRPVSVEKMDEVESLVLPLSDTSAAPTNIVQSGPTTPPPPPPPPLRPLNLTSSSHCTEASPPVIVCPSFHSSSREEGNAIMINETVNHDSQTKTIHSISSEQSGDTYGFPSYDTEVDKSKRDFHSNQSSPVHAVDVVHCSPVASELKTQAVDLVMNWKTHDAVTNDSEIHNGEQYLKLRDHNCLSSPVDMTATNHSSDERSIKDCSMENLSKNSAQIVVDSDECSPYVAGSRPSKKLKTFHRETE